MTKTNQSVAETASSTSHHVGRIEHFAFDLNDRVLIKEIQRPGVVEALTIDFLGPQYRVRYWDNSENKTVWLRAEEMERR